MNKTGKITPLLLALCLALSCAACQKAEDGEDPDPGDWQEQYELGMRYLSEGNYEEAILAFEAAIDIDPKQAEVYLGLAQAYAAQGDTDKALRVLRQGLRRVEDEDGLDALEALQAELGTPVDDMADDTPEGPDDQDTPDTPEEPELPEPPREPEEPEPDDGPVEYEIVQTPHPDNDGDRDVWIQKPVFDSPLPGFQAINTFFDECESTFLYEDEDVQDIVNAEPDPFGHQLFVRDSVDLVEIGKNYVSVSTSCLWWGGGTTDSRLDGYVFDRDTGARLTLADLLDAPEADFRTALRTGLETATGLSYDLFRGDPASWALTDYDFAIENRKLTVLFDGNEIADNATGTIAVTLDVALKLL